VPSWRSSAEQCCKTALTRQSKYKEAAAVMDFLQHLYTVGAANQPT
jgi:hypothetical protein